MDRQNQALSALLFLYQHVFKQEIVWIDDVVRQITVREGKGMKDRVTVLPRNVQADLKRHLQVVKQLHDQDLQEGFGQVYLPFALEKKYPNANREWAWQYVFPAVKRSRDPHSGVVRRHHVHKLVLQRAVKQVVVLRFMV